MTTSSGDDTSGDGTESLIPYDEIVQEALRSVVQRTLRIIEKDGLPGNHHFYIAFKTAHPDVRVPAHLRAKYPDEMTIVIQHRFWDMAVLEDRFEVGLSFNQRPEKIVVPYAAIVGFVDPSVNFALQFQPSFEDAVALDTPEQSPEQENSREGDAGDDGPPTDAGGGGSNVVALDRFRKK